jgi:uncharacterized protein
VILVDSGPLIAAAIVKQNHHRACVDLFAGLGLVGRRLLVPHTVVAETAYMLRSYAVSPAESASIRLLAQGDFVGTDILDVDHGRVVELIERYDDLPLGTTDASVVARG